MCVMAFSSDLEYWGIQVNVIQTFPRKQIQHRKMGCRFKKKIISHYYFRGIGATFRHVISSSFIDSNLQKKTWFGCMLG